MTPSKRRVKKAKGRWKGEPLPDEPTEADIKKRAEEDAQAAFDKYKDEL